MGKMDGLMFIVAVCQEMSWTYDEYMRQPSWFLTVLREKMIRDDKAQELAFKKAQHGR